VANLAKVTRPLIQLAAADANRGKKRKKIVGCKASNLTHAQAFLQMKEAIVAAPVTPFFDPSLPTKDNPDASQVGLGAWLAQDEGNDWCPMAFLFPKFIPAEMNYNTCERELSACS
jgi:hypothetical protein